MVSARKPPLLQGGAECNIPPHAEILGNFSLVMLLICFKVIGKRRESIEMLFFFLSVVQNLVISIVGTIRGMIPTLLTTPTAGRLELQPPRESTGNAYPSVLHIISSGHTLIQNP